MSKRLVAPSDLPATLWQDSFQRLLLPATVSSHYRNMLVANGLLEDAMTSDSHDGPVGGLSEADTRKHFATRFAASSARIQLAMLDPKEDLRHASDLFMKTFSGGRVGLLDIPCGAGAVSADLLCTLAALREAGVVPRQPLEVKLVAGDISRHARDYASDMIGGLRMILEEQAIYVDETFVEWNVLDLESTTSLLHTWMEWARDCREYCIVLANFSGFLQNSNKLDKAKPGLDEVFRWAAARRSLVMWLEPQTNAATEGLIPRILNWFTRLPSRFTRRWSEGGGILQSSARYLHPIKTGFVPRVQLNLIRLEASPDAHSP